MNPIDWPRAEYKLKQLIGPCAKSRCFPEELFGKELYPLRVHLEKGERSQRLYDRIINL